MNRPAIMTNHWASRLPKSPFRLGRQTILYYHMAENRKACLYRTVFRQKCQATSKTYAHYSTQLPANTVSSSYLTNKNQGKSTEQKTKKNFRPLPCFSAEITTKSHRNKNKLLQGEFTWQWSRGNNAFCGKQNHRHASAPIPQENKARIRTVGSGYMIGYQCRGTSLIHIYFFWISRWSKFSLKVFTLSVGRWFKFYLKNH